MNGGNELSKQIGEIEQGKSGYAFDSRIKLTTIMFRCHDIKASSFFKLAKPFFTSKSIVNIQNDGKYCFSWCLLAHKYKVDKHRERVPPHKSLLANFN